MNVSIIIPCRNGERHLGQTIGSALEQSQRPSEIIVVDDGSTDGSVDVAAGFGERVSILQVTCGNAAAARNAGFELASGDAVMFLDADDLLSPNALEAMVGALEAQPNGVALSAWFRLEKDGARWVKRPPSWPTRPRGHDWLSDWLLGRYYPPCAVLWSRRAYTRVGGWDERATVNDDGDIMMRALIHDTQFVAARRSEVFYRRAEPGVASLSGYRFSRGGIESELYVLRKVALMLEERGKLEPYRFAFGHAFARAARWCLPEHPDLAAQCRQSMTWFGNGTRRLETLSAFGGQVMTRVRRRIGRVVGAPRVSAQDTRARSDEITFGSRTAAAANASGEFVQRPRRPAVSVIVPTYNRAALLPRAIDSILRQRFTDFELIIVDDGSDDGTVDLIRRYQVQDPRVRLIRQPSNCGVGAARNRGLREARADLIAFLDSDDEWFEAKLERQIRTLSAAGPEVGLVYCGVETISESGERWYFRPNHSGDVYRDMLSANPIHSGSGVLLRRNVIRVAGFFDERIPAIEDYDYWLRVARWYQFEFVPEPLLRYYDTSTAPRKSMDVEANLAARDWFFGKHHAEMRRAGVAHTFLLNSAKRHLVPWYEDWRGARRLTLHAAAIKPNAVEPWVFAIRYFTPEPLRALVRPVRRAARELRRARPSPR
jgi:O-antigen biosynthesis protein